MKKIISRFLASVMFVTLASSCDPGFDTQSYILNLSSYTITISNYAPDGCDKDHPHFEPVTISPGDTLLFNERGGLGMSDAYDGFVAFYHKCPDGCEILFEDGKALHFEVPGRYHHDNDSPKETHSPYSEDSHEFELLERGFGGSTHGRTMYIVTDDDHDRAE